MSLIEQVGEAYSIPEGVRELIESLTLGEPHASHSFRAWQASVDFDALDYSSFRLVPAVFRHRALTAADTPHYARMKGIYRYFLYSNSLLLEQGRRTVALLHAHGIPVTLFKGAALSLAYHRNNAVRPMSDVDVQVPSQHFERAAGLLREAGWHPRHESAALDPGRHSIDFVRDDRHGFDLHRRPLVECTDEALGERILARAQTLDWAGLPVRVMAPEDLLLTSLCNGLRDPRRMRFGWIADVHAILAGTPDFDWKLLWQEASRFGLQQRVFDALGVARRASKCTRMRDGLQQILDADPVFYRRLLETLFAEGRSNGLDTSRREDAARLLTEPGDDHEDAFERASRLPGHTRHIQIVTAPSGQIERIHLQRRHLARIPELFDVSSRWTLRRLLRRIDRGFEEVLEIPPGLLSLPADPALPRRAYRARISLDPQQLPTTSATPGTVQTLPLRIRNTSPLCWPIHPGSPARFGVSLHIHGDDGRLLTWDTRRQALMTPRPDHLGFIEPGDEVACTLRWFAPEQPGRYRLELDIVHEGVCWFSRRGVSFPGFGIEVVAPPSA